MQHYCEPKIFNFYVVFFWPGYIMSSFPFQEEWWNESDLGDWSRACCSFSFSFGNGNGDHKKTLDTGWFFNYSGWIFTFLGVKWCPNIDIWGKIFKGPPHHQGCLPPSRRTPASWPGLGQAPLVVGGKALLVVGSCNHFTSKFCFFGALVGPNKVLETHLAQLT